MLVEAGEEYVSGEVVEGESEECSCECLLDV